MKSKNKKVIYLQKKNKNLKALIIFGLIFITPIYGIILSSLKSVDEIDVTKNPKTSAVYNNISIDDLPGSLTNWSWAESQPWFGGGTGSVSNPYIIEGHTFEGLGSGNSLSIENSFKYFIVRDCLLNGSGTLLTNGGLYLSNVTNAIVTNNNFTNNYNGIYFEYSDNIEIFSNIVEDHLYVGIWGQFSNNYTSIYDNTITNCQWGVAIEDGHDHLIRNNVITDTFTHDGILLYGIGSDCVIEDNYIRTSDGDGIRVNSFSDCVVYRNTIIDSSIFGLNLNGANNTLVYENEFFNNNINAIDSGVNNDWNNSMVGNYWDDYLGYDMDLNGIGDTPYNISGSAGTFDYLPIWNIQGPIVINDLPSSPNDWTWATSQVWCSGSGTELDPYIIEGMNIDANETNSCIAIWHSTAYFIIQNCSLNNSTSGSNGGVFLTNVTNGRIASNEFNNHRNAGVYGVATDYITVVGNSFENHQHGTYLSGSYNEVLDNTFFGDGTGSGIIIQFSSAFHDNLIDGNTIENCWQGIFIFDSDNNTISHNTAVKNLNYGIVVIAAADNNLLLGNILLDNSLSGILIDNSVDNTIEDTRAIANQQNGIYLNNADHTTIHHNRLIDNVLDGVHIATGSTNNLIYQNFFGGNGRHGYDNGASNDWNFTTIGNYWDNHTSPDTSPVDGIVDTPYTYIAGGAGSIDYLPIAEDGPPVIIINSPLADETFAANAPSFIVTVSDVFILDMWYSLDGGLTKFFFTTNGTIDQTAWDALPEGSVTITFYANDTGGNLSSESVDVVKSLPEADSLLIIIIVLSIVSGIAVVTAVLLIRRRKARKQS